MILETILAAFLLVAAQGIYRNWGKPTFDALPSHIDEPSEWAGKDHDKVWYTRWVKYVKGWFAVGPRSAYAWARWRKTPITLFAIKGFGRWRMENDLSEIAIFDRHRCDSWPDWYLSRVQYWCRWHFAVQWPLQITFHRYWNATDVPTYPDRPKDMSMKKMIFAYGPTHRDTDLVYWLMSFFVGGVWK